VAGHPGNAFPRRQSVDERRRQDLGVARSDDPDNDAMLLGVLGVESTGVGEESEDDEGRLGDAERCWIGFVRYCCRFLDIIPILGTT